MDRRTERLRSRSEIDKGGEGTPDSRRKSCRKMDKKS